MNAKAPGIRIAILPGNEGGRLGIVPRAIKYVDPYCCPFLGVTGTARSVYPGTEYTSTLEHAKHRRATRYKLERLIIPP
jgi:hypothetical protein